jgi:3-oxosteroid 1-dehydrogenase
MAEQHDWDVIVLGTGAAGLTAAFTAAHAGARVGLYEKADEVGGTSAWSGGQVWVPNNPHQADIGVSDSMDEAFTYIMSLSRGLLEERLVRAYLEAGPEMVRHLDEHAGTEFYAVPDFPDYHPEHPGGKPGGGRTIETPLISFIEELGEWGERVTRTPYYPNQHLAMGETALGAVNPPQLSEEEMEQRVARDLRGSGQALVGRLLRAVLAEGVVPQVGCRARELVLEDGRVVGVRIETPDGEVVARAANGVILASGGFEWNEDYKRAFLRGPLTHPVSVRTNTGDSLYMAMKAGAQLSNMREAWWMPAADLPEGVNSMNRVLVNADRTRPRSIMVNRHGRRFTNEAANYNAFGGAFHQEDVVAFDYANLPSWLIFDQEYLRRYGTIGPYPPSEEPPSWLTAYPSLDALAEELGIDADALRRTVDDWNHHVAEERDPDFHRGDSAHDRWWGDPAYKGEKRGTLGPLDEPPFYAIRIESGALGTKGGPRVDAEGRVLDLDGDVLKGLYAAGNAMGSPFGATYGGAGGTLGPAMVFGYISGLHAATK